MHLAEILAPFLLDDVEGFDKAAGAMAEDLAKASFGSTMLHSIGFMLANAAEQWMGDLVNVGAGGNAGVQGMRQLCNFLTARWQASSL